MISNTRSIEFQETEDKKSSQIVRKKFRIPVGQTRIVAQIDEKDYSVLDISPTGISIACDPDSCFTVSKEIKDCRLKFSDQTIEGLTGRVIHFSCGTEKDWHNGIQWIRLEKASAKRIEALVAELKEKLLKPDEDGDSI